MPAALVLLHRKISLLNHHWSAPTAPSHSLRPFHPPLDCHLRRPLTVRAPELCDVPRDPDLAPVNGIRLTKSLRQKVPCRALYLLAMPNSLRPSRFILRTRRGRVLPFPLFDTIRDEVRWVQFGHSQAVCGD